MTTAMFFFQDDIGILIQLATYPFWKFIFTPISANFAPLMNLVYEIEYHLFGLNFPFYFSVSVVFHILNVVLLYTILRRLTKSKFLSLLGAGVFSMNLTYTEPLLWVASQGILPATFFFGLAFLWWYENKFIYSLLATIISGFFYSLGTGIGGLFALATLLDSEKRKKEKYIQATLYFLTAIGSYLIGPLLLKGYSNQVIPNIENPLDEVIQYGSFVIAGVARGVVGRFFLPGFDPRHFEIASTVISFLPFLIFCGVALLTWGIRALKNSEEFFSVKGRRMRDVIILMMFIAAAYIWPGLIRYHFGLKQALAERYAYHGVFFFVILFVLMIQKLFQIQLLKSRTLLIVWASVLISVQTFFLIRNAILFEVRPLQTKQYFQSLKEFVTDQEYSKLPLPAFINQPFTVSKLAPIISP